MRNRSLLLPAVLIILAAFWLRLAGLMTLPLNWIEAANIHRAHELVSGDLIYSNIDFRKWLYPYLLVTMAPTGPESPWLLRSLSALMGVGALAAAIGLGRTLFDGRTALLAGIVYAVLPLAFFYERQVLSDPLLALLTTLTALFGVWLARHPTWWKGALLAAVLALAFFTKISALPTFVLPFLAIFLFSPSAEARHKGLLIAGVGAAAVIGAVLVTSAVIASRTSAAASPLDLLSGWFVELAPTDGSVKYETRPLPERLSFDVGHYTEQLWHYVGPGGLLLLGGAVVLGMKHWKPLLYLALPAVVFGWLPVIAERPDIYLAPRYLLTTAGPLAVLIAAGGALALERRSRVWRAAAALMLAAFVTQSLWVDARIIADPSTAPLPRADRHQYVAGAPSGYGYHEIAAVLLNEWGGSHDLHLVMTTPWEQAAAYLGPRVGYAGTFRKGDAAQRALLEAGLANGDRVFFVEANPSSPIPRDVYQQAEGRFVTEVETPLGAARIFEITSISDG